MPQTIAARRRERYGSRVPNWSGRSFRRDLVHSRETTAPIPTGAVRAIADGTRRVWDDGPDHPDDPHAQR